MKKAHWKRFAEIIESQIRAEKKEFAVAILCMLGFTTSQLISPWPLKLIFDHLLLEKPLPASLSFLSPIFEDDKVVSLLILSSAIAFIAIFKAFFSYFQLYITSQIGYKIVYTIQRELFVHLQTLSLSFHHKARGGELLKRVTGDTTILKDVFSEWVLTFSSALLVLLGMGTVMLFLNWKLSLIVFATLPFLLVSLFYLHKKMRATSKKQRKQEGKIAARLNEILTSVSLVQAFGRQKFEEQQFKKQAQETLEQSIRTARMEAASERMVEVVTTVGTVGVVAFGALEVFKGALLPGELLIFTSYVSNIYKPVRNLVKLTTRFSKALASAERIAQLLEVKPEIQDAPWAVPARELRGEIVFWHVSFGYENGKDILKNVSFTISPGQQVALVGTSGAGKSTVVSLLLRLFDPTNGMIRLDSLNVKDYTQASIREHIAVVFQDSMLFASTIRDNIAYGKPDAMFKEIQEAAKHAHAHEFIMNLAAGYDTVIGERGATLSGGQRQRICLARALIKPSSILVLDEPTSSLDAESEALICDTVRSLRGKKTIVVISHHFSSLVQESDQILVFTHGEIIEQGTHAELLRSEGYYSKLSHLQTNKHSSHSLLTEV